MLAEDIWRRARGRYHRTRAELLFTRRVPIPVREGRPLISFTFDDFPRSALLRGGTILRRFGIRGTYYASFGLMGSVAPTGAMFTAADAEAVCAEGHELGCHTFTHCDAEVTKPQVFEDAIVANRRALDRIVPGAAFETFAYPIGPPRALTKRRAAKHFKCCRGGGQRANLGRADLNYLGAYFLEQCGENAGLVKELIALNGRRRGWLIFATHDVDERPSPYGCTPDFFETVVEAAAMSGAAVLPVIEAWRALWGRAG